MSNFRELKFWGKWAAVNGLSFWVPMYFWLVQGSPVARCIFATIIFLHLMSGLFYVGLKKPETESMTVYAQDIINDACVALVLAYYFQWLAVAMFVTSCLLMRLPLILKMWRQRAGAAA